MSDLIAIIERRIARALVGLRLLLTRAELLRASPNGRHQVRALDDDQADDVEDFTGWAFQSRPKPGCEVVVTRLGGDSGHMLTLGSRDRRYRISLEEGESAQVNAFGCRVVLKEGKAIIEAGAIELGEGATRKLLDERAASTFDGHIHKVTVDGVEVPTSSPMKPPTGSEPATMAGDMTSATKAK